MTTYNTGNPLGSAAAKDLYDNAQNFDHLSNDKENEVWKDRFGVDRLTWHGMEKRYQEKLSSMGWNLMDSFQEGNTLTEADQALRWKLPDGDGEYYRWDGEFPKVVTAGSTPDSSGGIGTGAWLSIGDASLRTMLASSIGASMVGFGDGHTLADINDWEDGNGDSLIAVKQPATGSMERNQHDKNAEFLTGADFGVVSDGSSATPTDNLIALQRAFDASYLLNKELHLSGDIYFTGTLICRRQFVPNGRLRLYGGSVSGATFSSEIQMLRGGAINKIGLFNIKISFFPSVEDTEKVENKEGVWFYGNYGYNVGVYVGNATSTVRFIRIYNNSFYLTSDRSYPFVTLTNCSNVHVDNNSMQDYQYFVYGNATRSYVNTNFNIRHNQSTGSASVISLMGSAMNWFSNIDISSNTFSIQPRTLSTSGNTALYLDYVSGLSINDNNITSSGGCYRIRYSRDVSLTRNKFSTNTNLGSIGTVLKVDGVYVDGDSYVSSGSSGYLLNISADANTGTQIGTYVQFKNCFFKSPERAIIFSNYQKVVVEGCIFQRNSALLSSMIQINSTCLFGRVTNNDFFVPNGVVAISNSAITATTSGSSVNTPYNAASITVVSNGVVDSALNNSKSYIFTFNISDINQLHGYVSDTRQTLSDFVSSKTTNAKLAWNGGFYNSNDDYRSGDAICDGTLVDFAGRENYWVPCTFAINKEGKLLNRDFMCMGDNTKGSASTVVKSPVRNIAQSMISEGIINAQTTRPPLISSGIIYDATKTELYGDITNDTSLGARCAIGQKQDGTWILIVVDGISGSTGCTLLQLANKMLSLGAHHASNLDGGGSACVWYNGQVINNPSDGTERLLSSFMWI